MSCLWNPSDITYSPLGKLADNGIESLFRRKDLLLKLEVDGTIIGNGIRALNGMYILPSPNYENVLSSIESSQNNTMLWHQRLAHLNMNVENRSITAFLGAENRSWFNKLISDTIR